MAPRLLGPVLATVLVVAGVATLYATVSPYAPGAGQAAEPLDEVIEWCEETLNFTPLCEHAYQWCCEQYAEHHGLNLTCQVGAPEAPRWRWWEPVALAFGLTAVWVGMWHLATVFREYRSKSG